MNLHLSRPIQDERTTAVGNASYRWAYIGDIPEASESSHPMSCNVQGCANRRSRLGEGRLGRSRTPSC